MKVGFVGLGIMGKSMSKNLLKTGYEPVILDSNKGAVNEVVGCGAVVTANGEEAAEQCEVVITMVPNPPHVCAVVLGKNGVAEGVRPGTVVTGMGFIDPTKSKTISAELAKLGIDILDASVFGGEPEAIGDTPSATMGGKKELFDRYYDILMVMAGSTVYAGGLGPGSVVELASQIMVVVNIAAVSRILTLAKKVGTDPELVYQAAGDRPTGSTIMDAKAPTILSRNFKLGLRIELYIKGPSNALNTAHTISSSVPLTGQLMEIIQGLKADGCEEEDHSGIVKYCKKITNITVRL